MPGFFVSAKKLLPVFGSVGGSTCWANDSGIEMEKPCQQLEWIGYVVMISSGVLNRGVCLACKIWLTEKAK